MTDSNPEIFEGKIVLFRSQVPNCQEVIEIAEKSKWTHNDEIPDRYEAQISIEGLEGTGESIYAAIEAYGKMHGYTSHNIGEIVDSINMSKYLEGSFVGTHTDEDILEDTGESTLLLYLNDDYQGGDLVLTDPYLEIKPKAGDIVILPCYHEHYTKPTYNGVKYVSLTKVDYK